ncbi:MAG: GNAT family N-acetyltransferase [Clostridium sp.]|nr:GNAT family N-acetyltransferase [Clostridium sp.]
MKTPFDRIPVICGGDTVLRPVAEEDAPALEEMVRDDEVYRFLPTFLYERNNGDISKVIREMYGDIFQRKESLLLGIYRGEGKEFCGLAEVYGYKEAIHKACIGYRLRKCCWGSGIATKAAGLLTKYLLSETDVETITASTMVENEASARVLEKTGFIWTARGVGEDWGYPEPTIADKWFL